MKEPSEYLNLAKEKVASLRGFPTWQKLVEYMGADLGDSFTEEAALLALQLQQEDAEKALNVVLNVKHSVNVELKLEIEQLKAELSQSKDTANNHLNALGVALKQIDELKESIKGEKAKAFDEGIKRVSEIFITDMTLEAGTLNYLADSIKLARKQNPYKQDTQPKQ